MHFGSNLLPKAVDISWVQSGAGTTYDIREGEFVVRLDPSEQQPKNIALLACALVKRTTLIGIRHAVEQPLQIAIDMNLIRNLLITINKPIILDWFLSNEYRQQTTINQDTEKRNSQILSIDERGLFTRLLLVELEQFSKEMIGRESRPYMVGEIEGLIDFLYKFCSKPFGYDVPLRYSRAFIRIAIIIVAKTSKIIQEGPTPYIRAMQYNLEKQFKSIYILAYDKDWLGQKDYEMQKYFDEQLKSLGDKIDKSTVAKKTHDIKFSCLDFDGNHRITRLLRYISPEVK